MRRPRPSRWMLATVEVGVAIASLYVGLSDVRYRAEPLRARNAVGDAACLSCHQDKSTFDSTAHHLTSRLPSRATLEGSFAPGENIVRTVNPLLYFRMDSTARGYYETAVIHDATNRDDSTVLTHRIDIVTGSGRRGESFLYWRNHDRLYQLPISYWTMFGWGNSPNYRDGVVNFDRPIPPRCLECHVGRVRPVPDPSSPGDNKYSRHGIILGLQCETCHASGQEHVARERSPLHGYLPRGIVNPARLTRERQMDACALCHGGAVDLTSAPYSYVAGQPLHQVLDLYAAPDTTIDVHGNQVALLERSRCFRESQMTCLTCHDVHRTQRNTVELSSNCLKCHTVQSCGLFPTHGASLTGKCVDCHMPSLPSRTVVSTHLGTLARQYVRSHWIKVYPQFATTK